jgi:hypothetical protein
VAAFTLVEALLGMLVVTVAFGALYAGLRFGLQTVDSTDDELAATRIMAEKLDTIRLYSWDKIVTPGYIPTQFTEQQIAAGGLANLLGSSRRPMTYHGTTTIQTNSAVAAAMHASYRSNICFVQINLAWTNGSGPRTARMSTLVSKNGLQNYVY